MNYRMATKQDIPQLVELRMIEQANDWKDQYPITDELKEATRKAFERRMGKSLFIWVAEDQGKIVATAAVIPHDYLPQADELSGKRGYMCNVYTIVAYRRRGIQKILAKLLEQFCKDKLKIARLDLHASDGEEVRKMYESFGYSFRDNGARKFL